MLFQMKRLARATSGSSNPSPPAALPPLALPSPSPALALPSPAPLALPALLLLLLLLLLALSRRAPPRASAGRAAESRRLRCAAEGRKVRRCARCNLLRPAALACM